MKKLLIPVVLIFVLITSGCSKQASGAKNSESESKTITYKSESGNIKVPANAIQQ